MSEFTKGPWVSYPPHSEKDFLNSAIVNIESEDGCHVCSTTIYKRTFKEIKANANLIAAAPDNYHANKMVKDKLPLTPNTFGGGYSITLTQEEVDEITVALTKARGES